MNKENLSLKPLQVEVFDDISSSQAYFEKAWSKAHESNHSLPSEARFINLHYKPNDRSLRTNCEGGVILKEQVAENAHTLTFVYSPLPFLRNAALLSLDYIRREHAILHILEEHPLVQYLRFPFDEKKIHDAFSRSNAFIQYENANNKLINLWITAGQVMVHRKTTPSMISIWIHDIKYDHLAQDVISEARSIFPDIPNEVNEATVFLRTQQEKREINWKDVIPPQMKGKTVKGLFVDAAGTLFEDAELTKIRPEIAQIIHTESQKRWVYVWTGGDYKKLVEKLCDFDSQKELDWIIPLPKQLFHGLTVEETIDDMSQDQLQVDYKIQSLKHQQV